MNTLPIVPATVTFDERGVPYSPAFRDIYHPQAGALTQANHVFLRGNDLPQRWQDRDRFVVLETGFGLGNNFLATWQAWREDPRRCGRLFFISVEQHPLQEADLAAVHRDSPLGELAQALQAAWPPLTANLHQLSFDEGRVQLLLALGDAQAWLPELVASVDAFYLDGFAPATNPRMWDERVCKAIGRLAAPHATVATWTAAHAVRDHLTTAGFEVRLAQGAGGKRDITLARYEPKFEPRRAPSRGQARTGVRPHALIVGGGLAGCAAACALAEQGWSSSLLERHPQVAMDASGNPAGLFHGIVNAQDGIHARFNRAASFAAHDAVRRAIDHHAVIGGTDGLLRLETSLQLADMEAMLQRLGLPGGYVQALGPDAASAVAGMALNGPAWFYPRGGWVQTHGLARSYLERAGDKVTVQGKVDVHAIQPTGSGWCLIDHRGQKIDEAQTVVLANAAGAMRLLEQPDWPLDAIRGQLSIASHWPQGSALPRVPVAGSGYLLPLVHGCALFGATAQVNDDDASVRLADHEANLAQLERLLGHASRLKAADLQGRTAWRLSSQDRLPVIGAVPDVALMGGAARLDQPRFVPRRRGLYTFIGLGSRGITWSALGARILASQVTGSPAPVEASLLDAVDPARYVSRLVRRASAAEPHTRAGD